MKPQGRPSSSSSFKSRATLMEGCRNAKEPVGSPTGSLLRDPRRPGIYPAAFTMSKIGRYIDTTMPPTTTPRKTIIIGSISASSPLTAASTSSS